METHPNTSRSAPPSPEPPKAGGPATARWMRQYLVIVLVALGISLLLSPPTLRTEQATGAAEGLPVIETESRLTVRLARTLGEGEFQVVAKDLKTGETYRFGQEKTFDAASTIKLLYAAYLYHQAGEGTIDLDEDITIPPRDFVRLGTGRIQYQTEPYRGTWRDLSRLMMEQSDNTASHAISQRLGVGEIQAFGESLGLEQTDVEANVSTPDDMVTLLEAIHTGRTANPEQTANLLEIMDNSDFEDRLPAKLPDDVRVYHKTGDALGGGLHDAGLVEYQGHTYAVAIFTNRQGSDQVATKARMAEASRDIFAYFMR